MSLLSIKLESGVSTYWYTTHAERPIVSKLNYRFDPKSVKTADDDWAEVEWCRDS